MSVFRKEIESSINRCCKENDSNTPDFILANYLLNCLDAFTLATKSRDKWYSVHLEPCNSHFVKEEDAPNTMEQARTTANTPSTPPPKVPCKIAVIGIDIGAKLDDGIV
jgi:hypothetical protein